MQLVNADDRLGGTSGQSFHSVDPGVSLMMVQIEGLLEG